MEATLGHALRFCKVLQFLAGIVCLLPCVIVFGAEAILNNLLEGRVVEKEHLHFWVFDPKETREIPDQRASSANDHAVHVGIVGDTLNEGNHFVHVTEK